MRIQSMFKDNIDRKINGVIKVDQDEKAVIVQELDEYVITRELKKHFMKFFECFAEAINENTSDIGVWISGFYGSGKSHFLKMLSYLLENKEVDGITTVERFREKFADDPGSFMTIDRATKGKIDTILFDIDVEGSINQDNTAVLRVFAKMFYNYLGFYGEDLKVAQLEQFIDKKGKTQEFRKVFEEKNGSSWFDSRDVYAFHEDDIVETMTEVLGMSERAARNWFNGSENVEMSIAKLVSEIKEYMDKKPDDFRLMFMVDEVGQYVGENINKLLNLQSIVEKVGSELRGRVWIVCTGQEAVDEIIKARENEFSRIMARFKTRLTLSASAADEVIQRRLLEKNSEASALLEQVYHNNDSILRNIFTFTDSVLDMKGYESATGFVRDFPFVPYQYILMQRIYTAIRKHGIVGTSTSDGARSMLAGFQEAAKEIEDKNECALVPLYYFYDSMHVALDSTIRNVVERCTQAAENRHGLEPQDVNVLKLLFLVRYVDDIKANLDNIVILMADDIGLDKITMREQVRESLNRLMSQNYIGRTGDTYTFLTDEEQDIRRDIYRNTTVDTANIVEYIGSRVFGDIYPSKKYRYGKYDFAYDQMMDSQVVGSQTGGMLLQVLSVATDETEKNEMHLMTESKGKVIVVMAETSYYESLENAMKIRKYVKQRNISQLPKTVQDIIRGYQDEASRYEQAAAEEIEKAIIGADYYVHGEKVGIKGNTAKSKIDEALGYLVSHVYSDLELITDNAESDSDIVDVLTGEKQYLPGTEPNREAAAKIEEYLELQHLRNLPTSMDDIQKRYQAIPYGWKEIDIAAVIASLISNQKVTIKYGGNTIQPDDPNLPGMLRKRSEVGKTNVSIREVISAQKIRRVREFLRDYFDVMDVPEDEDGLVKYVVEKFENEKNHYESLLDRYVDHTYPDKKMVAKAVTAMDEVLSQKTDNTALIDCIIKKEDELYDLKDDLHNVESFFSTQVTLFDSAVKYEADLKADLDYIAQNEEANTALNNIRLITMIPVSGKFDYKRIPELNGLMSTVREKHGAMLEQKRNDLLEVIRQCMEEIHVVAEGNADAKDISDKADTYFEQKKEQIKDLRVLALLDGLMPPMWQYKDETLGKIESAKKPPKEPGGSGDPEIIKAVHRQMIFPARTLKSEEEIDEYLDQVRGNMKQYLKNCDGIKLN